MKYLLTILFFFIAYVINAQYIPNASAYSYKGILTRESLQPPQGCGQPNTAVNAPDNSQTAFYWDSCAEILYTFSPKTQTWLTISNTGGGGSCSNGLNVPGYVTWTGVGLIFDVTAAIYTINCTSYASAAGQITLDPADPTFPRRDVIAVDTNGAIVKITGVPSANPIVPQIDPGSQVYLTHIDVPAGATVPAGVRQNLIYDENAETYAGTALGVTINLDNTTFPYHLTKSLDVSPYTAGNRIIFFTRSGTDTASSWNFLKLFIRLKDTLANASSIRITLMNGNTAISNIITLNSSIGFSKTNIASYQNVTIPLSSFILSNQLFNRIRISLPGDGDGFYMDYIQLQSGVNPPPVQGVFQDTTYARSDSLFGVKANKEFFISTLAGGGSGGMDTAYQRGDSLFGVKNGQEFLVGIVPGGPTGIPGTQDTLWYNVKWFGAIGDGVMDDRAAIQNADDYVSSVGGGYIWFPAGTYIVNSPVYRHSYVNWEGVKDGSIIKNPTPTLTSFGSQAVMWMGNYNPSAYDTTVARFYRGHMGTFTNKMAIVDSISRFAVGDVVLIEGMTGWTSNDGHYKPYITRLNEVDSIYSDTVVFKYQIDTILTDARINISGHFQNDGTDNAGHVKYMVKNVTTRNLVFQSEGHWILGMTSLNSYWENISIRAAELFSGNGMAHCTIKNIYGVWWKQVIELAIGCHNTTFDDIKAHYINGPDDGERKPYIKFGEQVYDVTLKNIYIDAGNFHGTGIWFGASKDCKVDGIRVEGQDLEKTHIEFSDNSLDNPPGSWVNGNVVKDGYFKNTTNLQNYILMERSTTAGGQLKDNKVSNVTFEGPVADATAFVLDGYKPVLKSIYATEGEITGGDSLYKGKIEGGTLANVYDIHGNDSNIIIKSVSDTSNKVRSHLTDLDLTEIPDNTTIDGQLHFNKALDQLNFRHNGVTTDLLNPSTPITLQPHTPGYGILGSVYDGTSPQTWALDTSVLNGQIFIDSSGIEFFVDSIANAPTGTEANGVKYLVGTSPTGAFSGHQNQIATLVGGVWTFQIASAGNDLVVSNSTQPTSFYNFDGTNWNLVKRSLSIGGDQVGANIDIGTLDSRPFRFMTNGNIRERIDEQGRRYFNRYIGARSNNYLKIVDTATGRMDTASFTPLILTTNGSSGASTLSNDTLNIPVYTGGGGGSTNVYAPLIKSGDTISRRYNVLHYGATGNGIYDTTGAITSGSAVLTSVNSIFAAGDVGKTIVVIGAGTSGRDLVTTILTFTSATQVTLNTTAGTTVSSRARIIFGTDQTVSIQNAINAAYAGGGGTVTIPNGIYLITGALQIVGTINMNSQLYIPADSIQSLSKTNIIIEGETAPNYSQYGALVPYNMNIYKGSVLVSTLTTGATGAAVIGTKGFTGTFGTFNYNYLTVNNLSIKVLDNPGGAGPVIGGISYKNGASLITNQVTVFSIGAGQSSVVPTNDVAGIETPDYSSEAMSNLTLTLTGGFRHGYKLGEHTNLSQVQAYVCYYAFTIKEGYHLIHGDRMMSHWSTNDIYTIPTTNPPSLKIDAFDVEYITAAVSGGKWYDNIYTINDSLSKINGSMFYTLIGSNIGRVNTHLTKNGAVNFNCYAVGDSSNFFKLNASNTIYAPAASLIQTYNADGTAQVGFKWQKTGVDKWRFSEDMDGANKADLTMYDFVHSAKRMIFDSTGNVYMGGNISSAAGAAIQGLTTGYANVPNRLGVNQPSPSYGIDVLTATAVRGINIQNSLNTGYAGIGFVNNGSSLGLVGKAGSSLSFGSISNSDLFIENGSGGGIAIQADNSGEVKLNSGTGSTPAFKITTTNTNQFQTSIQMPYVAKTAAYTATALDYLINCTSGTFQVTLPTAASVTGRIYNVVNSGSGTITIGTTSSQTFVNITSTPTTLTLGAVAAGAIVSYEVMSNGANWIVIGKVKNE